jgi:hypothetical protein
LKQADNVPHAHNINQIQLLFPTKANWPHLTPPLQQELLFFNSLDLKIALAALWLFAKWQPLFAKALFLNKTL